MEVHRTGARDANPTDVNQNEKRKRMYYVCFSFMIVSMESCVGALREASLQGDTLRAGKTDFGRRTARA
jgi:hypothetical protein